MAVKLEYYNVIIPIKKINQVYPGGFNGYLKDYKKSGRPRPFWHDENIFHDGAMGPEGVKMIAEEWEARGLVGVVERNGEEFWKDYCVIDFMSGPTLPCDWIEYVRNEKQGAYAYFKDRPMGEIISESIKAEFKKVKISKKIWNLLTFNQYENK